MGNRESKGIIKELKELKDRIVYVMTHRKEIIEQYGSMDNFYIGNLKRNLSKDFPLITKYIKLRKTANERYHGDIDQFYKDMFLHTKQKAIETYGDLATAILSYPVDSFFSTKDQENVEDVNEALECYKELDLLNIFSDYFKLCNKYSNYFKSIKFNKNPKKKFSKEELIFYARKIIEDIDPSLVEDFDNFVKGNSIKIIKSITIDSCFTSKNILSNKGNRVRHTIYVVNEKPIDDIVTIVHEFLHFTNNYFDYTDSPFERFEKKSIHSKYTEFISIYFEYYAFDYLKDRLELDGNLNNYYRHENNIRRIEKDIFIFLPFAVYKEYGEYNFETFKLYIDNYNVPIIPSIVNFHDTIFRFKRIYNFILKHKDAGAFTPGHDYLQYELRRDTLSNTLDKRSHLLCTLLYYKVRNKLTKKDVLHFSKLIRKGSIYEIDEDETYRLLEQEHKSLFTDDAPLKEIDKELTENKGKRL